MKLIGRTEEEGRFRLLLQEPTERWISVLGLGGVGKSRFVAHLLRGEGSSVFVPLCEDLGTWDDRLVSSLIRHAQVRHPEKAASVESVLESTKFLVIENGELLRDNERRELEGWLDLHRGLRIIATSRVSTHPVREHVFFLESLRTQKRAEESVRDVAAVQLLEATLKTHCSETFDPRVLADIAVEVGGLPLALVVLAPTIATFGAPQTLTRLRAGGQVFVQETPVAIHALAFAWEVAPEAVVTALRALSVFDGSFSIELAAVLVPSDTHKHLRSLRDRSLIEVDRHDSGVRYRLHPIVRSYVRQLAPDFVAACTEELDEYVLEQTTKFLFTAPFTPRVGWVVAEYGAIYAALKRVQACAESTPERLARAGLAAVCLQHAGVPVDESTALAQRLSDPAVLRSLGDRGDCLLSRFIGMQLSWAGDVSGPEWLERSQKCAQGLEVDEGQVELSFSAIEQRCHRLLEDKDVAGAKLAVEKMRSLLPRLGSPASLSSVKAMDALSQRGEAEVDWVLGRLLESRRIITEKSPYQRAWLSARLADMALDAGRTSESLTYAKEAMELLAIEHPLYTYSVHLAVMSCLDDPEQVRTFLDPIEEQLRGSEDQGQLWTVSLARLMLVLHRRDWSECVTRTEQLLLATPPEDPESKLILGLGLAIVTRLETPLDSNATSTMDVLNLPESKSPLLERFRAATIAWFEGARAEDAFSFPIRPTATPQEAVVTRMFVAGALDEERREVLEFGLDLAWAILPGGERFSLSAKPTMRRLMMALIEGHQIGVSLSTDQLFERGWPKESIRPDSARNRVRVALSRLRKAGFEELLERTRDGTRLRPSLQIVLAKSS